MDCYQKTGNEMAKERENEAEVTVSCSHCGRVIPKEGAFRLEDEYYCPICPICGG